jgi:hypothetical protein
MKKHSQEVQYMKQLKRVGLLLLTLWMVAGVGITDVSAAKKRLPPAPMEGTPSNNPKFGSIEKSIDVQATEYIKNWNTFINNL